MGEKRVYEAAERLTLIPPDALDALSSAIGQDTV